jgi:predicted MFS family arabinose efflux permease
MWYFVSLYLQQVLGFDPIEAGLSFLPMTAAIVVCSQVASRLTSRVGPGPVLTIGMTSIALGMLWFTQISPHGTWAGDVLLPSLLCAGGIGFSFVPVTIAATAGVAGGEAGLASGLINTSRQIGGSLGLALLATVATQRTAHVAEAGPAIALTDGFQRAFAVGAGIAAAGAIVCLAVLVRGIPRPVRAARAEA